MYDTEDRQISKRKKSIKKAILSFIAVMMILTFLSNTINNLSLPRVEYEFPSRGSIVKEFRIDGIVEANEVEAFFIPSSMRVLEIHVRAGEKVVMGQPIMTLDTKEIERQLRDEQNRYEQKEIQLAKLRHLSQTTNLSELEHAIESAERGVDEAQRKYERVKKLYDESYDTRENLEIASSGLEDAKRQVKQAILSRENAIYNMQKQAEINELETKSLLIDMDIQRRKIQQLKEQLHMHELTAPFDGIIAEMGYQKGEMADTSRPAYTLVDISKGYCFKGVTSADNAAQFQVGDEAEIAAGASRYSRIWGRIIEIRDLREKKGEEKEILFEVSEDTLVAGQKGSAIVKKHSMPYDVLVSNSAIGQDNNGHFVYVLKEKRSHLGDEIYVQMARVTIQESDDRKTAVLQGLNSGERVIKASDKPLSDGMRVIYAR